MSNRRESVLVVEDDPNLVATIRLILEYAGLEVRTAMNGKEALAAVEESLPGVILLDMKMPVMNGWEFAREFFSRYGKGTPIIVLTAAEDAKKRAAEIDAHDYLGKPFDIEELLRLVTKHLAAGKAA